jgi:hypothetical protein
MSALSVLSRFIFSNAFLFSSHFSFILNSINIYIPTVICYLLSGKMLAETDGCRRERQGFTIAKSCLSIYGRTFGYVEPDGEFPAVHNR